MVKPLDVVINDVDIQQFVKRCQEKEEAGYECIVPMKKIYTTQKQFHFKSGTRSRFDKTNFAHMEDRVSYRAVYRKKGETA